MPERRRYDKGSARSHSNYEEALRRSDERMNGARRSARPSGDAYGTSHYGNATPARYRQRSTRPLDAGNAPRSAGDIIDARRREQHAGRRAARDGAAAAQRQHAGGRAQMPQQAYRARNDYREQQLQQHARDSQNYRARPATFSTTAPAPPVSGTGMIVRIVLVVVLLVAAVVSFGRISAAQGALGEAQNAAEAQSAQVEELNSSNAQMQSQLDSMTQTIDAYDKLAASGS